MSISSSHITDENARLAELNSGLLALEKERVELLSASLVAAQGRVAALEIFIGAISSPAVATAASVAPAPVSLPKKKRGRKPGSTTTVAAAGSGTKASGPKKRAARGSASGGDRVNDVVEAVKAAGKEGISARKLGEQTNIPYTAVRKIVAESGKFVQKGEKRASRVYLK